MSQLGPERVFACYSASRSFVISHSLLYVCDSSQQANICCVVCHSNILCLLYFYCYSTCPVACFLYSTCPIVCDSSQQNVGSPQANICCVVCHPNILCLLYFYCYSTCPFFTQPVLLYVTLHNKMLVLHKPTSVVLCVTIVFTLFLLLLYLSCCLFSLLNLSYCM